MSEIADLLKSVPSFAGLPADQVGWFLSQSRELTLNAGETYARQGEPADAMFVLLEGEFQWRGELAGESFALEVKAGEVTGVLPFSRMKQFSLTGRATTAGRVLRFPAARFPDLVQKMPELATRLVGLMSDRIREATRFEQQRDRLAALGKLSAGLAHELNNPASAAKRSASQLRELLKRIRDASHELGRRDLSAAQKSEIEKLEASVTQADVPPPDPLTASDLEQHLADLRPGGCDQGIHLHGPVAGAERRHREDPGKHSDHPESQAQTRRHRATRLSENSTSREFLRERAQPDLDQHHRQCH